MTLRKLVAPLGLLSVLAVCAYGTTRLRTDNTPPRFFRAADAPAADHARFTEAFGPDRSVRLVLRGTSFDTPASLAALAKLHAELNALPGVAQVLSPQDLHALRTDAPFPPADAKAFAAQLEAAPLAKQLGLAQGKGTRSVLVTLAPSEGAAAERELLRNLREAGEHWTATQGGEAEVIGLLPLNQALDRSAEEVGERIFPLLVLLALILTLARTRSLRATAVAMAYVSLCELTVLGLMGWAGASFNLVLVILPPVLFAIALATVIHMLHAYTDIAREAEGTREDWVRRVYLKKRLPLIWAGLTTGLGFLALLTSDVLPVQNLGLWAALGMATLTTLAFWLLPYGLRCIDPLRCFGTGQLSVRLSQFAVDHRRWVVALAALLLIAAGFGAFRIRTQTNALSYLPKQSSVRHAIERAEAQSLGSANVEVLLEGPADTQCDRPSEDDLDSLEGDSAPCGFWQAEFITRLTAVTTQLNARPELIAALSASSLIQAVAAARELPEEAALAALREHPDAPLKHYLSADGRHARITLLVRVGGADALDAVRDAVTPLLAPLGADVAFTGTYARLLDAQRYLVKTLSRSLTLSALLIMLLVAWLTRRPWHALAAMLSNLWPVALMLGVMGALRVPLDISTAMVATVVLGLAVDDSLHTLAYIRKAKRLGSMPPTLPTEQRVLRALAHTGPAYVTSSLALSLGFGVCMLSSFGPTARFGGLATLAILLALLSDLTLLPALLSMRPGRNSPRKPSDLASRAPAPAAAAS